MADRRGHGPPVSPELNLESERLRFRPFGAGDVDALHGPSRGRLPVRAIALDPLQQVVCSILRRARSCARPHPLQFALMFAKCDPHTNDRIDERRQLHAAESAFAGALLLAIGDLHDDVGLSPIVDDSQPLLAAQGLAQFANGGEPPLQGVAGRRAGGDFSGNDVDADRFLSVGLGLTATESENGTQRKRDNNDHD